MAQFLASDYPSDCERAVAQLGHLSAIAVKTYGPMAHSFDVSLDCDESHELTPDEAEHLRWLLDLHVPGLKVLLSFRFENQLAVAPTPTSLSARVLQGELQISDHPVKTDPGARMKSGAIH